MITFFFLRLKRQIMIAIMINMIRRIGITIRASRPLLFEFLSSGAIVEFVIGLVEVVVDVVIVVVVVLVIEVVVMMVVDVIEEIVVEVDVTGSVVVLEIDVEGVVIT
jgi:hypothetical protein